MVETLHLLIKPPQKIQHILCSENILSGWSSFPLNSDKMQTLINILVILASLVTIPTTSTGNSTLFVDYRCSKKGNYTANSLYQYSLYNLLGTLTLQASKSGFFEATYGEIPQQAFALYMCRGDLGNQACSDCVNAAKDYILKKCPYETEALIYYNNCKLRFSNQSFFGKLEVSPHSIGANKVNITGNRTRFKEIVVDTMTGLAVEAAAGGDHKKFAKKANHLSGTQTLFATAQCVPDLTTDDCHRCLEVGIGQLPVSRGARVVMPSCCVRYELYAFFDPTANPQPSTHHSTVTNQGMSPKGKRKHTLHIVIFIISSISIISFILMSGIWIFKGKKKASETSKAEIKEFKTMEALEFDLNTIKAATCNFSIDNKLGEGGFGEVYKGKLKDGQEVAIKRLSKNSRQGIEEFKNEVVLVARLQHKNLIKLLGFCLASKEKLLIYEFLRNLSLDHFLFDFTKKLSLIWEVRFKLIVGIARGLLYLHEDSRLKIIHRDLKPSNILLDEHMNPKISDFGLAKLFGADQTQDDTKRIVGTYGYMAPEYAITGHFSVKSDVYSFGIIVLEIISGQKNRFFGRPQREEALLHRAWRLWNEEKYFDLVDTTLENNYPREEVTKCIHIGLLCIQENAVERPRMATIVAALNGQSVSLHLPKAPRFFGNIAAITNRHSERYNSFRGGNEMDHHLKFVQQDCTDIYTGSENITTFYPR